MTVYKPWPGVVGFERDDHVAVSGQQDNIAAGRVMLFGSHFLCSACSRIAKSWPCKWICDAVNAFIRHVLRSDLPDEPRCCILELGPMQD